MDERLQIHNPNNKAVRDAIDPVEQSARDILWARQIPCKESTGTVFLAAWKLLQGKPARLEIERSKLQSLGACKEGAFRKAIKKLDRLKLFKVIPNENRQAPLVLYVMCDPPPEEQMLIEELRRRPKAKRLKVHKPKTVRTRSAHPKCAPNAEARTESAHLELDDKFETNHTPQSEASRYVAKGKQTGDAGSTSTPAHDLHRGRTRPDPESQVNIESSGPESPKCPEDAREANPNIRVDPPAEENEPKRFSELLDQKKLDGEAESAQRDETIRRLRDWLVGEVGDLDNTEGYFLAVFERAARREKVEEKPEFNCALLVELMRRCKTEYLSGNVETAPLRGYFFGACRNEFLIRGWPWKPLKNWKSRRRKGQP